ncbi:MAG: single-stranded DNA-binding protein [Planctomycetota bacterium]|nr:single-stranded DNA-binding protein [Planctomycetota bacterium]
MPNLNRVMLMGNLTRDPELRYLPNTNMAVVGLGLAINHRWKNQQGESKEDTTFVDCEAFGRTAEVLNQYLKKGRPVYLEGRLKLDQWKDKEGNARSKMKVVIDTFQFIDSRGGGGGEGGEGGDGGEMGGEGGFRGGPRQQSAPRSSSPRPPSGGGNAPRGNQGGGGQGGGNDNAGDPHQPVQEDDIPF